MTNETALPPELSDTRKIVMLHMNYRSRAAAHGDFPAQPTYYLKPPSTLVGPGTPVARPAGSQMLIAEGEIALVIGERVTRVQREEAWSAVSHVAAANDLTVLDFMWADPSLTRAKGWDGFTPIGPLVDASSINPDRLEIRATVNGAVRQRDTTDTLLFPFADLVSDLSHVMTLEPGDVILSGTPAGARPVVPGDHVTVEIPGLSSVTTPIVEARQPLPALCPEPRVTPMIRAHGLGVAAHRPAEFGERVWTELRRRPVSHLAERLKDARVGHLALPFRHLAGGPVAGHALTVRLVPRRQTDEPADISCLAPLRAAGPNEIVVVAARGAHYAACLPTELLGQLTGLEAIVTDGGLRTGDTAAVPITAYRGAQLTWEEQHRCAGINVPVVLDGVLVEPGDLVVADGTASLVIPANEQGALAALVHDC